MGQGRRSFMYEECLMDDETKVLTNRLGLVGLGASLKKKKMTAREFWPVRAAVKDVLVLCTAAAAAAAAPGKVT